MKYCLQKRRKKKNNIILTIRQYVKTLKFIVLPYYIITKVDIIQEVPREVQYFNIIQSFIFITSFLITRKGATFAVFNFSKAYG